MAECRCGDPGCEHCGGGEPSTVPDRGQAFTPETNVPPEQKTLPDWGLALLAPVDGIKIPPASGHPVRDLADAIRAIAVAHATGYPFAPLLTAALALANKLDDGTHGCDTCRAALSLTKETVADLSPSAERSPPTMITATQAAP
jgi:hypothetical protein